MRMNTIQAERKGVEEVSLEARLTAAEGLLEEERVLVSELRATMEKQSIMLQRLSMQRRGLFTAPVRGVYFTFYSHAGGEWRIVCALFKNGHRVVTAMDHSSRADIADTVVNGATLQLNRGDQVYTRLAANTHIFDDSQRKSTFSGFLLFTV
eukprot:XP_014033838.1 PREDICTED: complement C1q-like protein 2 [Salmo salar]